MWRLWRMQNLCISLQECHVCHVLLLTVRRAISWDKCALQESPVEQRQHWCIFNMHQSCWKYRHLTNFSQCPIPQALGRVMQTHSSDSTWSQYRSSWACSAWPGPASIGLDLSGFVHSHLCSCTAWPSILLRGTQWSSKVIYQYVSSRTWWLQQFGYCSNCTGSVLHLIW